MDFGIQADDARRLVVVTVSGSFDAKSVAGMVSRARELAVARRWGILYDMRAALPGGMGSAELYWMPRRLPALQAAEAARIRVAVLYPPDHAGLAEFWETTFRNANLQARAFAEESAALDWLRG